MLAQNALRTTTVLARLGCGGALAAVSRPQVPLAQSRWSPAAAGPQPRQQAAGIVASAASDAAAAAAAAAADGKAPPLKAIPEKIGFIGAGQMGEALIRGFLRSKVSSPGRICCSIREWERQSALTALGIGSIYGDATDGGAQQVAAFSDIVVLCTKPQAFPEVLQALAPHVTEKHLVISIAAGITLGTIEEALGAGVRCVRVMPNTPALVGCGATAYALGRHATDRDGELVDLMFSSVGFSLQVEEKQLDAVTGLSGSGPAYIYMVIEALADGGVAAGLPRDTALALAAKTVAGAAQMVFSDDDTTGRLGMVHPGVLKDRVASPAGTTIAGLTELESSGVRGAFIRAVTRAAARSKELAG